VRRFSGVPRFGCSVSVRYNISDGVYDDRCLLVIPPQNWTEAEGALPIIFLMVGAKGREEDCGLAKDDWGVTCESLAVCRIDATTIVQDVLIFPAPPRHVCVAVPPCVGVLAVGPCARGVRMLGVACRSCLRLQGSSWATRCGSIWRA
jgi:hypothetical protein